MAGEMEDLRSGNLILKYLQPSKAAGPSKDNLNPPATANDVEGKMHVERNIFEEALGNRRNDGTEKASRWRQIKEMKIACS